MKLLSYVSELLMPFLILYVVGLRACFQKGYLRRFYGGSERRTENSSRDLPYTDRSDDCSGNPACIRISGLCGRIAGKLTERMGVPSEILPLTVVRMFSSSAAVSLLLDIFKEYGTDSAAGLMGAVIMSATESVFYCMSVYFAAAKIEKTRYTLPGALIATLAGTVTAIFLVQMMI